MINMNKNGMSPMKDNPSIKEAGFIGTYHGIPVIDIRKVLIDTNIIDEQISQCQGVTALYMNAYTWKAMDIEHDTYKGIPINIRHELPFGMVAIEEEEI